jgi:hypothetical protein
MPDARDHLRRSAARCIVLFGCSLVLVLDIRLLRAKPTGSEVPGSVQRIPSRAARSFEKGFQLRIVPITYGHC